MEIAGAFALLLPNAVYDIKKRKISLLWTFFCAAIGLAWQIYRGTSSITIACSLFPCGILWLAGFLKKGSVGAGDAFIMGALGIWCGFVASVWILGMGCMILSLICIPLLALHRIQKDSTMPFVPFLLAGLLLWYLCVSE